MRTIKKKDRRKSPKTYPREGLARIEQAAEFLNCERSTVYVMINAARLRTILVGSQKRIPWAVLWAHHDGRPQAESSSAAHLPITPARFNSRFEAIESSIGDILKMIEVIARRLKGIETERR